MRKAALATALAVIIGIFAALPAQASLNYSSVVDALGPMAYWRLGEPTGSATAVDASGNGNNGTYAGCVDLGATGAIGGDPDTAAFVGQDLGCDMTYQPAAPYAGDYTAEAWVNPSSTTKALQTFLDTRAPDTETADGDYAFDLKLTGTDSGTQGIQADIGDGSEWLTNPVVPFSYTPNTWYFVAATVTQSTVTIYANGAQVDSESIEGDEGPTLLWDADHPLAVGGDPRFDTPDNPTPENFDGAVDEPAFFSYALSGSQVQAQYAAAAAPPPSSPPPSSPPPSSPPPPASPTTTPGVVIAQPGVPATSPSGPPTDANPTEQILTLPKLPGAKPLSVTLESINPGPKLSAADRLLCPTTGNTCSGQISVFAGNFTSYVNQAHPIQAQVIAKWKTKVPPGKLLMAKDTGGPPVQLARCVTRGGKYNTPCAKPEIVKGSAAKHNLTTTDTILFVGTDPRFARHVDNGPDAPTAVKATAGKGRASITWKPPVVTNGRILTYAVTPHLGKSAQKSVTVSGTKLAATITGLRAGTTYTFTLVAKTASGVSLASKASNAVKPT
jgi:hypothetical protein